jgi:hypothetical protein
VGVGAGFNPNRDGFAACGQRSHQKNECDFHFESDAAMSPTPAVMAENTSPRCETFPVCRYSSPVLETAARIVRTPRMVVRMFFIVLAFAKIAWAPFAFHSRLVPSLAFVKHATLVMPDPVNRNPFYLRCATN